VKAALVLLNLPLRLPHLTPLPPVVICLTAILLVAVTPPVSCASAPPTVTLKLRQLPTESSWRAVITARLPAADIEIFTDAERSRRKLYQACPGPLPLRCDVREYQYPIDLGYQGRATPEFCPGYLPEQYPGKALDEFCYQSYTTSPWLSQQGWANPFQIAEEEVQTWNDDRRVRWRRAALAAAYAVRNRNSKQLAGDIISAVLGRQRHLSTELMMDVIIPPMARMLPDYLTDVTTNPGQTAIDLRVETTTSFDSANCTEDMLLTAAERGLQAVVIADRNRIDGAQRAQRIAQRLQAQGHLPAEFQVLVGEYIQTLSGGVLAVFVKWRVPEQMTMKTTLDMIHKQGGLAILAHPGVAGGPRVLRRMPFDGYLIQPGLFGMFRTLNILYDPTLADKPALYASNSPYAAGVGLPYSIIETDAASPESLKTALREGQAYAAGGLHLPWMTLTTLRPVGEVESVLNRFFVWHDAIEGKLCAGLGADNATLRTTWDRELQGWMGLDRLPEGIHRIANRTSPLLAFPHLSLLTMEYSHFQLYYDRAQKKVGLTGRYIW